MVPPAGTRPKDFTLVKKDGVYHLFYIRHNDLLPPWATENDFGHATTTDLYHWTQLPPVLGVGPGTWDNLHVWAPHVVSWGGLYWMFYTGVTEAPGQFVDSQRTGTAFSTDLMTWTRAPEVPVWTTQGVPWAWWAPLRAGMACRDPFVMPDPAAPGQWLMYYTASPVIDTMSTLIGVARSTGDPGVWHDLKPLWITHRSFTFNQLTESPQLFQHNGRWFLFITTSSGQPLTFYVSSDPTGDPAAWTYRGRLGNMLNYDTSDWNTCEVLHDGDLDLFAVSTSERIEIHTINWGSGDNFSIGDPLFFHMVSMDWTRSTVDENRYVGLRLKAANGIAFHPPLVAWVKDATGLQVPVSMAALGIPDNPDLSHDSTQVRWFTRRWPVALPPGQPMKVRVATADGTASTGWLTVYTNLVDQPVGAGPGGRDPDDPDGDQPDASQNPSTVPEDSVSHGSPGFDQTKLRVITGSPLAGAPVVLFDMSAQGNARVELFDVQGRRLATLADRGFAPGAQMLAWDGRDAAGARVPRGLYFVRLTTRTGVRTSRFLFDRP
jgi:beta-fructofuranosidase